MKRTGRTTLNRKVFHVVHGDEITADLGIPKYVKLEGKEFHLECVFFNFAQYHSTIPDWAYKILVRVFAEEKRKHHQADFDDCDFVLSLKLPTFQFSFQGGVTTMGENDKKRCVLAVQTAEMLSSAWMVGAAF